MELLNIIDLKATLFKIDLIKRDIVDNFEEKYINLCWEEFIYYVSILPATQSGIYIQNKVIKDFNFKKIKASEDLGDCIDTMYNFNIEIKASIINDKNLYLNVNHLRMYQNVDYYYFFAFDIRNNGLEKYLFVLSKSQLEEEMLNIPNLRNSNGTKNVSCEEKKFEIKIDSDLWNNFISKYGKKF